MPIDIFDFIHYLIGIVILAFFIWVFIRLDNYFSKDNIKIIERNVLVNKV
jgi:hypothetical protein